MDGQVAGRWWYAGRSPTIPASNWSLCSHANHLANQSTPGSSSFTRLGNQAEVLCHCSISSSSFSAKSPGAARVALIRDAAWRDQSRSSAWEVEVSSIWDGSAAVSLSVDAGLSIRGRLLGWLALSGGGPRESVSISWFNQHMFGILC